MKLMVVKTEIETIIRSTGVAGISSHAFSRACFERFEDRADLFLTSKSLLSR